MELASQSLTICSASGGQKGTHRLRSLQAMATSSTGSSQMAPQGSVNADPAADALLGIDTDGVVPGDGLRRADLDTGSVVAVVASDNYVAPVVVALHTHSRAIRVEGARLVEGTGQWQIRQPVHTIGSAYKCLPIAAFQIFFIALRTRSAVMGSSFSQTPTAS